MSSAIPQSFVVKGRTFRLTPVPPTRDRNTGRNEVLLLAKACKASTDQSTGKFLSDFADELPEEYKSPHFALLFPDWPEYNGDNRFCKCVQWNAPPQRWCTSTRELNHISARDRLYLVSEIK
jgi:hypothetical protein